MVLVERYQRVIPCSDGGLCNKAWARGRACFWTQHVSRKRDRILKTTKSNKYWMRTHNYGVEIPHTIGEAKAIDEKTGTTLWMDSITKEQTHSVCAFKSNSKNAIPKGYTNITTHMVFDVKLGTLARKARLCTDGHKVPGLPKASTYSSIPSRDSVRILFLLAALNGLEVLSAYIQNAYLSALLAPGVKYYTIAKEPNDSTADQDGRPCIIVRALYGLPTTSGRDPLIEATR